MINNSEITATCRQHSPKGYVKKRRKSSVTLDGVGSPRSITSESSCTSGTFSTVPTSPYASQLPKSIDIVDQNADTAITYTTSTTSLPLALENPLIDINLQQQPPVITTATKLQQNTNLNVCSANETNNNINNNYNDKLNSNCNYYNNNDSNISKFLRSNKKKSFFKLFVIYIIIYTTIFSQYVTFILGNQLDQSRRIGSNETSGGEFFCFY
jgi:hypothetical protein